ncbi:hypothetical protein PR202_ga02835 [Eleusine coracana subsp. coracana]|uniref:Uncharacterized protein n=1 Tax=Eleusine coracana subsp. coracana TaxID=191504 RepID=A0AAV5BL32_ELECO|nr:hypothetical protein PR202_ga02835 [Eleusine coracana subsp. coracana]
MSQIDAAIASTEYARACTLLDPPLPPSPRNRSLRPRLRARVRRPPRRGLQLPPATTPGSRTRRTARRARRWERGGPTRPCGRCAWRSRAARRRRPRP